MAVTKGRTLYRTPAQHTAQVVGFGNIKLETGENKYGGSLFTAWPKALGQAQVLLQFRTAKWSRRAGKFVVIHRSIMVLTENVNELNKDDRIDLTYTTGKAIKGDYKVVASFSHTPTGLKKLAKHVGRKRIKAFKMVGGTTIT